MKLFIPLLLTMLGGTSALGQETVLLNGGATSVREVRGDWVLLCGSDKGTRACNLRQEQRDALSNNLVTLVELVPASGALIGSVVLPFGLNLAAGVTLQIDDGTTQQVAFRTCVPNLGCAALLSFAAEDRQRLERGNRLRIAVEAVSGQAVEYGVSLKGIASALSRANELLS